MKDPKCKECWDQGWLGVQHPMKPAGVSMCLTPCPKCNPDSKKPLPNYNARITVTNGVDATRYPTHTITTTDGDD